MNPDRVVAATKACRGHITVAKAHLKELEIIQAYGELEAAMSELNYILIEFDIDAEDLEE
jgi:hypothetical protein